MSPEESLYAQIGRGLDGAEESKMFGKPCFKTGGKAFACYFQQCMVFKLPAESHRQAIALEGAVLFDPSGKGRAMKEWVQVPYQHEAQWPGLAQEAMAYVEKTGK